MAARPLRQGIERYCAWYKLVRSWTLLQAVFFAACAAVALYILCDKVFYFGIGYLPVILTVAIISLFVLLVYHLTARRKASLVSYLVDKSAGLKNLVSSGISVAEDPDEVSTVVVNRATAALQSAAPARLLPFRLHWTGLYIYIPVLLLLVAFFIPHLDLAGRKQKNDQAVAEQAVVKKGALKLAAKLTSIQSESRPFQSIEGKKITEDFNTLANDLMGVAKKEALLKLGEFENKYRDDFSEQRDFEKAATALQTKPDMQGLAPETEKQLKKLMQNLSGGNFKDAGEALRELAEQLKSEELTTEQKQALAREMRKMAEQMQGCGSSEDLAKLLRDIEASPEDIDELLRQCESAAREMGELANLCDESGGLKAMKEGLAEAKEAMLGDSFSDFDAMEVEQYLADEAGLGDCEGAALGAMPGNGSGNGTGGEGKGRGGLPLENMTDTAFKSEMSPSKINKGKILQQIFISGIPEKGEASVEYADVVEAAKQHAASSLAREQIPREYEDIVKTYFDSLELQNAEDGE